MTSMRCYAYEKSPMDPTLAQLVFALFLIGLFVLILAFMK
jgi:hypothetical protein